MRTEAELKAARDARYAARKKRKSWAVAGSGGLEQPVSRRSAVGQTGQNRAISGTPSATTRIESGKPSRQ